MAGRKKPRTKPEQAEEAGRLKAGNDGGFENRTALAKPEHVGTAGQNNGGFEARAHQKI